MTDSQKLGDIFKQAADIAQQVPDALREIAFQRALDALLGGPQATSEVPATGRSGASQEQSAPVAPQRDRATHSASVTKLLEVLDRTEMAALLRGRKVLDRSLLLLRAAQHHDIDALTAADIAEVLAKKFREPTTASAIRMALDVHRQETQWRNVPLLVDGAGRSVLREPHFDSGVVSGSCPRH